ncbi:unnamed protein product [Toxocara canis]|uniref:WIF domain-containing protein n=1 Tax=Toxocara canis TaxID=6265 RepID=A0A183VBJ5_TOXCA|nr:unnamed protein product [Toxocara canis]
MYSTKFPYRVDTNVSQVVFSWNTKVTDRKIAYTLRAIADDNAVLPVILIPRHGYLPTSTEDFTIEYRCAGNKAGQFDVSLHLNFSWPSETNNTYVVLKQEKLCASRDGRRLVASGAAAGEAATDGNERQLNESEQDEQLIQFTFTSACTHTHIHIHIHNT